MRMARSLILSLALLIALGVSQLSPAGYLFGPIPTTTAAAAQVLAPVSRGYLVTPAELREIKRKADLGKAPYVANRRDFFAQGALIEPDDWPFSSDFSGVQDCSDGSQKDANGRRIPRGPRYLIEGGRLVYGKMIAAYLSNDRNAEQYARSARARLLDLTDTTGWGGNDFSADNQCVLYLSWYTTSFVMAADLLEEFPAIWSSSDKQMFQEWLAREVFPKAAWASRSRTNNWGSGGSYAAAMIADYLWDSGLTLEEKKPRALKLTPAEAYQQHTAEQLSRMSTTVAPRDKEDSRCLPHKGIQPSGGIPDELRRANISNSWQMCQAAFLPELDGGYSSAYTYQITHIETLVAHAELALRRGDHSLYDNIAADGSGSILRAIKFIVANPTNPSASYEWDEHRQALLYVAYRYYRDPTLRARFRRSGDSLRSGDVVTYGELTHEFASSEDPADPPVTDWSDLGPPRASDPAIQFEPRGGEWVLSNGVYTLSKPVRGLIGQNHGNTTIYRPTISGDYQLSVRAQVFESGTKFNDLVVIFSYHDPQNYAFVSFNESNDKNTSGIFQLKNGVQTELADITTTITSNTWYELGLNKSGASVSVRLNGAHIATASNSAFDDGRIGLATFNDAAVFSELLIQPAPSRTGQDFAGAPAPFEAIAGKWELADGTYRLNEPQERDSGQGLANLALYQQPLEGNFSISVRVRVAESGSKYNDLALIVGYRDPRTYAFVSLNESNDDKTSGIFALAAGVQSELADIALPIKANTWYTLELQRTGSTLRVLLDQTEIAVLDNPAFVGGRFGFASLNDSVAFDDLLIEQPAQALWPLLP